MNIPARIRFAALVVVVICAAAGAAYGFVYLSNIEIRDTRGLEPIEANFHEHKELFEITQAEVSREEGGTFYFTIYRSEKFAEAIREVWDGGEGNPPEVRYYFFDEGQLKLVKRLRGRTGDLDRLKQGSDRNTTVADRLFFENGVMTQWIGPDGVPLDSSDPRWADLERFTLLSVSYYSTGLNEAKF